MPEKYIVCDKNALEYIFDSPGAKNLDLSMKAVAGFKGKLDLKGLFINFLKLRSRVSGYFIYNI